MGRGPQACPGTLTVLFGAQGAYRLRSRGPQGTGPASAEERSLATVEFAKFGLRRKRSDSSAVPGGSTDSPGTPHRLLSLWQYGAPELYERFLVSKS